MAVSESANAVIDSGVRRPAHSGGCGIPPEAEKRPSCRRPETADNVHAVAGGSPPPPAWGQPGPPARTAGEIYAVSRQVVRPRDSEIPREQPWGFRCPARTEWQPCRTRKLGHVRGQETRAQRATINKPRTTSYDPRTTNYDPRPTAPGTRYRRRRAGGGSAGGRRPAMPGRGWRYPLRSRNRPFQEGRQALSCQL